MIQCKPTFLKNKGTLPDFLGLLKVGLSVLEEAEVAVVVMEEVDVVSLGGGASVNGVASCNFLFTGFVGCSLVVVSLVLATVTADVVCVEVVDGVEERVVVVCRV